MLGCSAPELRLLAPLTAGLLLQEVKPDPWERQGRPLCIDMLESYTCRPSSSACREGLAIRQTHGHEHTQHQLLIRKGYRGFLENWGLGGGAEAPSPPCL